MIKRCALILLGIGLVGSLHAQDPNFSLNYSNPMMLNPALSGLIEGKLRVNAGHRWRKATADQNYQTSMLTAGYRYKGRLLEGGAGMLVSSDYTPGLRTNNLQASFAYEAPLGTKVRYHHLRAGFQAGLIQRRLENANLLYEDQFDGTGFNLPTAEDRPRRTQIVPDVGMGVVWYRTQKIEGNPEFNHFLGFSVKHLNRPQLGFYDDATLERANIRWTLHGGGKFRTRGRMDFNTNLVVLRQNNATQWSINGFARYKFYSSSGTYGRYNGSLMAGAVYRSQDAAIAYAGFDLQKQFALGVAFDFYTGGDQFTRNTYGGLHVMASYLFGHDDYEGQALPFPFF
jgi:type IX secretion system PorP/SprF family membrane protein